MQLTAILALTCGLALGQGAGHDYATVAARPTPPIPSSTLPDVAAGALSPEEFVAGLGGPSGAGAQPIAERIASAALTLVELEQLAEANNPTLMLAAARVEAARGECLQVGLYPNPVITYQGSEIGNEGRAGQHGGFLGQEIVTAGKLRLNQEVARQQIREAQCEWEAQRFRVLTDVRSAFYNALAAQRTVDLSRELVRIGAEGVTAAERLVKAQESSRTDLLQAKIESDSAKLLLVNAENLYAASWRGLAATIGVPSMQPMQLTGSLMDGLNELRWEDTLSRLLTASPEIAAAQADVARAQAAVRRECAGRIPNVDLEAGVQYDNATGDTIAHAGVAVPLPLFNRNQGNIRRAQAELIVAQKELNRVELALQQRLATVFQQYSTARQQVDTYTQDILPNAQEALTLVSAGYQQGEFSYLVMLTAQRTYFQTNLDYLNALRALRTTAATIEGNLLSDSLQTTEPQ